MTITLEMEYEDAQELCSILARSSSRVAVDAAAQMQDDIQDENARLWERQQERFAEDGGVDDSVYRRDMQDAGRGHLLR